jgi:hypothetical protein
MNRITILTAAAAAFAAALAIGRVDAQAPPPPPAAPQTSIDMQIQVVQQRIAQDTQTRDTLQKNLDAIRSGALSTANVTKQLDAVGALLANDQAELQLLQTRASMTHPASAAQRATAPVAPPQRSITDDAGHPLAAEPPHGPQSFPAPPVRRVPGSPLPQR